MAVARCTCCGKRVQGRHPLQTSDALGCCASQVGPQAQGASALLIGADYPGKLIHDGWASYDRFWRALHQTCLGHLIRRCRELLETAKCGAVVFPRKVKALLGQSLQVPDRRDARQITVAAARAQADGLPERMTKLVTPVKSHAANERLAGHLQRHTKQWFTFLRHKGIDATNHRAEQAIRPAVVNRKVWGGNRTEAGAVAQSVLMTVLFTATRNGCDAMEMVSRLLCAPANHRPLLLPDNGEDAK